MLFFIFSRLDATPWGQNFLVSRINDPQWAPVFVDQYTIIFLKINEKNEAIIKNHEIPYQQFRIIKSKKLPRPKQTSLLAVVAHPEVVPSLLLVSDRPQKRQRRWNLAAAILPKPYF